MQKPKSLSVQQLVLRLRLERKLVREIAGNLCFLIGFIGLIILLWNDGRVSISNSAKTAFEYLCRGLIDESPQGFSKFEVWVDSSSRIHILPEHDLIVLTETPLCSVHVIPLNLHSLWLRISLTAIFGIQLLIDFYSALHRVQFTTQSIYCIITSFVSVGSMLVDCGSRWYLGYDPDSLLFDSVFLLLNQDDSGIPVLPVLATYQSIKINLWVAVAILALTRLLIASGAHPRIEILLTTVKKCLTQLMAIMITLLVMYCIFALGGYVIFSPEVQSFTTMTATGWTQFNMILTQWPFPELFSSGNQVGVYLYIITFACIIIFTVLRVYLGLVQAAFESAQSGSKYLPVSNAVVIDLIILVVETFMSLKRNWPSRSEAIRILERDDVTIESLNDMRKYYFERMSHLLSDSYTSSDDVIVLREAFDRSKSVDETVIPVDAHLTALHELNAALAQVKEVMKSRKQKQDTDRRAPVNEPPKLLLVTAARRPTEKSVPVMSSTQTYRNIR